MSESAEPPALSGRDSWGVSAAAREPDAPRHVVGRVLNFGSPVVAAVLAVSSAHLIKHQGMFDPGTVSLLLIGNAALAAVGSGIGAALRPGRIGVRVVGALAYGVLALFAYGVALAIGFMALGIR
jgi:hypothetical protein